MIFDELVLHDFGVYAGQQSIKLTPSSSKKPVIMFYGLNGCGKTTILEALQIVLFGQQSPFLEGQDFNQYIKQRINKNSRHGQTSLRLDFHRSENGKTVRYRIYRVWKQTLSGMKENLEVIKDGHKNNLLSSKWSEHVEEIISARLAHFFFFDGEKIEEYASAAGAQELISTGLYRLLGIDLISKSKQDLAILKRRKLSQSIEKNPDDNIKLKIEEKQANLKQLEDEKENLATEKARVQTHEVDKYQREIDELNKKYKSIGKDLWDRREEIKDMLFEKRTEKSGNEEIIREVISGILPLFLVSDDFAELEQYKKESEGTRIASLKLSILEDINKQIESLFEGQQNDSQLAKKLTNYLTVEQKNLSAQTASASSFIEEGELNGFNSNALESELQDTIAQLQKHIEMGRSLDEQIDDLTAEDASVPDFEEIKDLTEQQAAANSELMQAEKRLNQLDDKLTSTRASIDKVKSEIDTLLREGIEVDIEHEQLEKYITRLDSADAVLEDFSGKIIKSKVKHIEQLILESYQVLLRKEDLLKSLFIDPETLTISLNKSDDSILSNSQLSAGERQLLSISILWGLAKASLKPFPVAVDTPFGRLDSTHRTKLVLNYFTRASHQILLFSTDEEIVGDYFETISPSVSWIYRLNYDSQHSHTKVEIDHAPS